jgi:multisubunit Na+/H+ antiporter MnhE subunit
MTSIFLSILTGACLAMLVFRYVVSGRSDVTLRNWRGVLVYFMLAMGAIQASMIVLTLLSGLMASP